MSALWYRFWILVSAVATIENLVGFVVRGWLFAAVYAAITAAFTVALVHHAGREGACQHLG